MGTVRPLGRLPALDGLRGVAILLVLGYHLGWIRGGYLGVDVFFVLSGFLITTLLLEEHDRTGAISLRRFYVRRVRRLLPALAALLVVVTAIAAARWLHGRHQSAIALAGYVAACLFYAANIVRALGHVLPAPLKQVWSLAEEEQFYLLWPPLLVLMLRRRAGVLPVVVAAAVLLAVAWRMYLTLTVGPTARVSLAPDTHADPLLLGCLLALLRFRGSRLVPRFAALAPVAAAVVVTEALLLGAGKLDLLAGLLVCGLAAAAAIGGALDPQSLVARILSTRPLVRLGVISYSVYVWHLLVFDLVPGAPIKLVLAIGAGALSYRYVEQPLRHGRRPLADRAAAAAAAAS